MPLQHGFEFTIKGKVFVPRESSAGGHVIDALNEIDEIRAKIQTMLLELPVDFTCTQPKASSRQEQPIPAEAEKVDPPATADDGEGHPF